MGVSRTPIWFLGTGALLLTIFFILFVSEFNLTLGAGNTSPSELQETLREYHFLLTPLLVVVAGSLGAYSYLARDFVTRIVTRGRGLGAQSSEEKSEPALLYLIVGGLFGFLGGLVIPSALLVRGADLTVFNPASLAVLSALAGFAIVNSYSPFIARMADELREINTGQVAEAVQKALEPPPLVNFDGYLACIILEHLLNQDSLYIINAVLTSPAMMLESEGEDLVDADFDVPDVGYAVSGGAKVGVKSKQKRQVMFKADVPVAFAFQAAETFFEDGEYVSLHPDRSEMVVRGGRR
jgi:hypothetical protein